MSETSINRDSKHGRRYHGVQACALAFLTLALTHGISTAFGGYDAPCDLDTSFGGNGKVTTGFGESELARALALQTNGKIVAVGYSELPNSPRDFALARYQAS